MIRSLKYVLPLVTFLVIGWFLMRGLDRNPREIPSPLIGKPAPDFSLPLLADMGKTWSPAQLKGEVWLLNVWGSWCSACQIEHPLLMDLAKARAAPLVGLAWKDMPDNSKSWLKKFGDPYDPAVMDFKGKVAIDYGVYGAPETFVIDKQGIVRYKHVGPITLELVNSKLLPLLVELKAGP